jgi:hypothetical protein
MVLIVPFVIQLALVAGLVGYISSRNGQRAVNEVAHDLRSEIAARIEEHLRAFLATPHGINRINANALRQGVLDATDSAILERYFWEQLQIFDSVTSIYFGNTAGGLVDAGVRVSMVLFMSLLPMTLHRVRSTNMLRMP